MKIAIVNDLLGSGSNGTFVAMNNLVCHLREEGHEVLIICADKTKIGNPDYFVLKSRHFGKRLDRYIENVGVSIAKCSPRLMDEALKGADYIHCMTPFALGQYAAKYAKEHGIPISAGFHMMAENITAYFRLNKFKFLQHVVYRVMYRRFFKYMDGIHYPTEFVKELFEKHIGKSTPAYVVSNGADRAFKKRETSKPDAYKDRIVITSIGRYSYEKAQEVLIKAVEYSKYEDKIQLIFAGQGARDKYYKKLARRLPISPVFKVFNKEELADVLNYSDIYVHPARIELEGIAFLEAIKCGALTLASDSPLSACKGMVADNMCVFGSKDYKELGWLIDYWIDHPDAAKQVKEKNLSSDVKYVDECMIKMDNMISDVMRRKREEKSPEKKEAIQPLRI